MSSGPCSGAGSSAAERKQTRTAGTRREGRSDASPLRDRANEHATAFWVIAPFFLSLVVRPACYGRHGDDRISPIGAIILLHDCRYLHWAGSRATHPYRDDYGKD